MRCQCKDESSSEIWMDDDVWNWLTKWKKKMDDKSMNPSNLCLGKKVIFMVKFDPIWQDEFCV